MAGRSVSTANSRPHGGEARPHHGCHTELYPHILGNSDTGVCFFLALSYGLADYPLGALQRMIARVERARAERNIAETFRATMCASNGKHLDVLRWIGPDFDARSSAAPGALDPASTADTTGASSTTGAASTTGAPHAAPIELPPVA